MGFTKGVGPEETLKLMEEGELVPVLMPLEAAASLLQAIYKLDTHLDSTLADFGMALALMFAATNERAEKAGNPTVYDLPISPAEFTKRMMEHGGGPRGLGEVLDQIGQALSGSGHTGEDDCPQCAKERAAEMDAILNAPVPKGYLPN